MTVSSRTLRTIAALAFVASLLLPVVAVWWWALAGMSAPVGWAIAVTACALVAVVAACSFVVEQRDIGGDS